MRQIDRQSNFVENVYAARFLHVRSCKQNSTDHFLLTNKFENYIIYVNIKILKNLPVKLYEIIKHSLKANSL